MSLNIKLKTYKTIESLVAFEYGISEKELEESIQNCISSTGEKIDLTWEQMKSKFIKMNYWGYITENANKSHTIHCWIGNNTKTTLKELIFMFSVSSVIK